MDRGKERRGWDSRCERNHSALNCNRLLRLVNNRKYELTGSGYLLSASLECILLVQLPVAEYVVLIRTSLY
jgi:hypothetical protein